MNDQAFVEAARAYIGTPWRDKGRARTGLDCLGLIAVATRDCGLVEPFNRLHGSPRDYHALKPVLCDFAGRIAKNRFGALLIYRKTEQRIIHIAIATEPNLAIHIEGPHHCVVESTLTFPPLQIWGIRWPSSLH